MQANQRTGLQLVAGNDMMTHVLLQEVHLTVDSIAMGWLWFNNHCNSVLMEVLHAQLDCHYSQSSVWLATG